MKFSSIAILAVTNIGHAQGQPWKPISSHVRGVLPQDNQSSRRVLKSMMWAALASRTPGRRGRV